MGQGTGIPGVAALNTGLRAPLTEVSCSSAGNCTAAGEFFTKSKPHSFAGIFVTAEKNGTWGKAELVPGVHP